MKKRIGSINAQPKAKLQVLPFPLTCVFSFVSFFTYDVKKTTFLVGFCLPDSFDLSLLLIGRKKNRREKLQLRIYAHAVTTTYVTTRMPRPIFVFFFFLSQPFGILPLNALRRKRIREKKKNSTALQTLKTEKEREEVVAASSTLRAHLCVYNAIVNSMKKRQKKVVFRLAIVSLGKHNVAR